MSSLLFVRTTGIMRIMQTKAQALPSSDQSKSNDDDTTNDTLGPSGQENWSESLEARELAHKIAGKLFVDVRTVYKVLRREHVRGVCGMRIKKELQEILNEDENLRIAFNG
jgi:hypothetical protein